MDHNITRNSADDTAWGPEQVARYLDVSARHVFDVRREDASFPAPRMVGSRPRWCPDVVRRWVADGGSAVHEGREPAVHRGAVRAGTTPRGDRRV